MFLFTFFIIKAFKLALLPYYGNLLPYYIVNLISINRLLTKLFETEIYFLVQLRALFQLYVKNASKKIYFYICLQLNMIKVVLRISKHNYYITQEAFRFNKGSSINPLYLTIKCTCLYLNIPKTNMNYIMTCIIYININYIMILSSSIGFSYIW